MGEALKQRIRQSGFPDPVQEALLNILVTADFLRQQVERICTEGGITGTQYNVLRILRGAGPQGLCRNEVGERLVTKVPDVTRLLDRMEAAGLILRQRGGEDRRFVATQITEKGLKLLEKIDRELPAIHGRQIGHVSQKRLRELIGILEEVRAAP